MLLRRRTSKKNQGSPSSVESHPPWSCFPWAKGVRGLAVVREVVVVVVVARYFRLRAHRLNSSRGQAMCMGSGGEKGRREV